MDDQQRVPEAGRFSESSILDPSGTRTGCSGVAGVGVVFLDAAVSLDRRHDERATVCLFRPLFVDRPTCPRACR